jgi:putative ATP-dependent endonuclease of OLD family
MRLSQARIRNYRGIRDARIDFDDLVVFIGENGCGKSSLLNALEACLGRKAPSGAFEFQSKDIYYNETRMQKADSISIQLSFEETEPNRAALLEPLRAARLTADDGLLNFQLKVEAYPANGGFETTWKVGRKGHWSQNPEVLQAVREACPMVRIRCRGTPLLTTVELEASEPLTEQIREAFRSVMESKSPPPELLEAAILHLHEFLKKFEGLNGHTESETLRSRLDAPMKSPSEIGWLVRHLRASGVQSLALLAVASIFIEARGPGPLSEGSFPIITLEDPEVHLHPLVSRTVWSLLDPLEAQKVITTNSSDLLSAAPLSSIRRMVRRSDDGLLTVYRPRLEHFDSRSLRRATYHVRVRNGSSLFMRVWLLVEGESEFWLLNEVARVCGYDLAHEGVTCVEFAQSGLEDLVKLAASLGIGWHILCDGDRAGQRYRETAERLLTLGGGHIFQIREKDLEHCLWKSGFEGVYRRAAGPLKKRRRSSEGRKQVIKRAVRARSKPHLALEVAEEMHSKGPKYAPPQLRKLIENVVTHARRLDPIRCSDNKPKRRLKCDS